MTRIVIKHEKERQYEPINIVKIAKGLEKNSLKATPKADQIETDAI